MRLTSCCGRYGAIVDAAELTVLITPDAFSRAFASRNSVLNIYVIDDVTIRSAKRPAGRKSVPADKSWWAFSIAADAEWNVSPFCPFPDWESRCRKGLLATSNIRLETYNSELNESFEAYVSDLATSIRLVKGIRTDLDAIFAKLKWGLYQLTYYNITHV